MPSLHPREPEITSREDAEHGFLVNIYDGEYLIQVCPHENGYRLSLASKSGQGDRTFLRTFDRNEDFKRYLEREYPVVNAEFVFDRLEDHFDDDTEYRIVGVKPSIEGAGGRGANITVETGQTVPELVDEDYRSDQWQAGTSYRVIVWPNTDYLKVHEVESGKNVAKYWPDK